MQSRNQECIQSSASTGHSSLFMLKLKQSFSHLTQPNGSWTLFKGTGKIITFEIHLMIVILTERLVLIFIAFSELSAYASLLLFLIGHL